MGMIGCSWAVVYDNGEVMAQYDVNHPKCKLESGEVPLAAIEWPRVSRILFESQLAADAFDVTPPPAGYKYGLKARQQMVTWKQWEHEHDAHGNPVWLMNEDGTHLLDERGEWVRKMAQYAYGVTVYFFAFCTMREDAHPVETTKEDVINVFYWMPDGSRHECHDFLCNAPMKYNVDFVQQSGKSLVPRHGLIPVDVTATIVAA
jgi:hypothetical protein